MISGRDQKARGVERARQALRPIGGGRSWALFGALLALNATNLVFHSVASHLLGPASYGALASLLSILLAVSVAVGAAQIALTGEVARRCEDGEPIPITRLLRRFLLVGLGAAGAVLAAAPAIRSYLHLDSALPVVWLALYLVPLAVGIVPWASLCGRRRFGSLALAVLAGAVVRVGAGAALIAAGAGVPGALAATFLSEVVLAGVLLLHARPWTPRGRQLSLARRDALLGVSAVAGLWALVGLDTLLARHYLPPADAGAYAAASVAARGALFVAQAAAAVALPALACPDRALARRALARTTLAAVALGALAGAALTAGAGAILPAVFGDGFHADRSLVGLLALAATGAGALNVLLLYHVLQRSRAVVAGWIGVLALPLLALPWHGAPHAVAAVAIVAVATALAGAVAGLLRRPRPPVRPALAQGRGLRPAELDLTVVVPFHAAGEPLRRTLVSMVEALDRADVAFEVIAVADGCAPRVSALSRLAAGRVRCLSLDRRSGKGEALRVGLREGRGAYLGFIDGDGELDPTHWQPFLALMRLYGPDAVIGSKFHPLSEVASTATRRVYSWGYKTLSHLLFRLPVRDTQVGIKLFRRELMADVLPRTVERGFVFDLELLAVAHRLGYRRLFEAPVSLRRGGESTIRLATAWRMLLETLGLAWRLKARRYYDRDEPEWGVPVSSLSAERAAAVAYSRGLPLPGLAEPARAEVAT